MPETTALTTKSKLNLRQQKFCELYATDAEFFGNGVQSYMEAYDIEPTKKGYATARSNSHRLLTNADILAEIDNILEVGALNNAFVDKQLAFLVTQNADFGAKMAAIKEYNALKKRIAQMQGGVNIIALILKKWGLDDVEQTEGDEGRISEG